MPDLATPLWQRVITEKARHLRLHARPGRPDNATALAGLVLAGDYTAGEYPATLEAAVRSGAAPPHACWARPGSDEPGSGLSRPMSAGRPKTAVCRTPLAGAGRTP
jgi:hypothetical protein